MRRDAELPPILRVGRAYRHAVRYRQILSVLFRYGFEELLQRSRVEQYVEFALHPFSSERREQVAGLSLPERVRMVLVDLGPTFVKMGQVLSTRPDLLPMPFIRELERLQDDVPPFPFEEVRRRIEEELGRPLGELFAEFDEEPVAAASIGQVHRARLPTGEEVAVKVRRPDVRRTVEVDLEIATHLAALMEEHVEALRVYQPRRVVEEFAETLERELDYSLEASNLQRFAHDFAGDPFVRVPEVFPDRSGPGVLCMEFVRGIKMDDADAIERAGCDRRDIARRGADLVLKQVFVHGFFHADPHPGNLFVLPGGVICMLDFGMVGRIGRRRRHEFADLVIDAARRDESRTADALLRLTTPEGEVDRDRLERDVAAFIDRHLYRPLERIDFSALLQDIMDVASRHRLRMDPNVAPMLKALGTVQGLATRLDPDLDLATHAAPFLRRLRMERLHPARLGEDAMDAGAEMFELARDVPRELREALRSMRKGRIAVAVERQGIDPALETLEKVGNRLAFAIVLAALLIGSSLIVLAGIPPTWRDIPVIGLAGFVAAGVMGLWLLAAFLKKGML